MALKWGHRRLPIYEGDLDAITGVVRLRDLVDTRNRGQVTLNDLAFTPLIIPESKRVTEVLEDMQASQTHVAIVVDEYGSTSGMLTIEDVA